MKKQLGCLLALLATFACADTNDDLASNNRFGQKIMTGTTLSENADRSGVLLLYCIDNSWYRLGAMYPKMSKQEKSEHVIEICQPNIDTYSVDSVLLAADHYGQPKSEKQAWQIIQDNRRKGTDQGRQELHEKIRQYMQTLDDNPPARSGFFN
ncbi:hypothetical protein [Neisseria leonii]|uniref:hypothetical protein n=1 Tax=Neisseria leonii TaxID=2995413 RepID=UPI00237BCC16|nr:hypothetical protein [Neisseria sp. 3986]MDD9324972.1 hypothetical protein [Neisseria sp. 3986]